MMAILVGVGVLAAFVLLVALCGWEPRGARVADARQASATGPREPADGRQIAKRAARELD